MEFARPLLLLLLPLVGSLVWLRSRRRSDSTVLRHSHLSLLVPHSDPLRVRMAHYVPWLSGLALLLVVIGAAGPRQSHSSEDIEGEGIDIVLSLDISGSMRSLDFEPQDRLGAAKDVIRDFIAGRPNDRVGLVVFAARAFTQCPLTLDHQVLTGFLDEVEVGLIEIGRASCRERV